MHDFPDITQCRAKFSARVEHAKIIGAEPARFQQCNRQRITDCHLQKRRCRRCQTMRTGLIDPRQDQRNVSRPGKGTVRTAGDRDQGHIITSGILDQIAQFRRFAGPGQGQHSILLGDHAQITVAGFRRMNKE